MPIKRRLCRIGTGYAVFLPKSWVCLLEEKHGKINSVSLEVNGKLTIRPILKDSDEVPK